MLKLVRLKNGRFEVIERKPGELPSNAMSERLVGKQLRLVNFDPNIDDNIMGISQGRVVFISLRRVLKALKDE